MTASSLSPGDADQMVFVLSPEALDCLRGHLLAERGTWSAHLSGYEATMAAARTDAFGAEVRQLAKASIARIRDVIDDIDRTLERLVDQYGSCEWCDTDIPPEQLTDLPRARLCRRCARRAFRSRSTRRLH